MKVTYDEETDILLIVLRDAAVSDSDEGQRGVLVDYGADGELVAIEVVDATDLLGDPAAIAQRASLRGA